MAEKLEVKLISSTVVMPPEDEATYMKMLWLCAGRLVSELLAIRIVLD